jgi:hypothetical protein
MLSSANRCRSHGDAPTLLGRVRYRHAATVDHTGELISTPQIRHNLFEEHLEPFVVQPVRRVAHVHERPSRFVEDQASVFST